MKLNKLILFLILFFSFVFSVRAQEIPIYEDAIEEKKSKLLKYNVESLEFDYSGSVGAVRFTGWARKAIDDVGDHNIGGKNLKIYIAAISRDRRNSDGTIIKKMSEGAFLQNINDVKKAIMDSVNNGVIKNDKYNYLVKETSRYFNGNKLYGSLCYKTSECLVADEYNSVLGTSDENKSCCYKPHNLKENVKKKTSNASVPVSNCDDINNDRSACDSYDTGFDISFALSDLEFGVEVDGTLDVEFLIFILHAPYKNTSVATFNAKKKFEYYNDNFLSNKDEQTIYYDRLAVADAVCKNCDILEMLYGLDLQLSSNFLVDGSKYRITEFNKETKVRKTYDGNYFNYKGKDYQGAKVYEIVDSGESGAPTPGFSVGNNDMLTLYKLKVTKNDGEKNVYLPCSGEDCRYYWAWSTWGKVFGSTILTVNGFDEPDFSCEVPDSDFDCAAGNSTLSCLNKKTLSFPKDASSFLALNFSDGENDSSFPARLEIMKTYKVTETISVAPFSVPFNDNYKINEITTFNVDKGRSFNFSVSFNKEIDINDVGSYYYKLIVYLYGSGNSGITNYVSKDYLLKLINNGSLEHITESDLKELEEEIDNGLKSGVTQKTLDKAKINYYNFFDSNKVGTKHDNSYSMKIIGGSTYKNINLGFKTACINNSNANVFYKDSNDCENGFTLGSGYFIPFNVTEILTVPSIKVSYDDNDLFKEVTYKFCKFKVNDGNLNYKYRVIDLGDPFPNDDGTVAKNWSLYQEDYKKNKGFLLERKKSEYRLDLNEFNIKKIREHNNNLFTNTGQNNDYLYINSKIDNNGNSDFINEYLITNDGVSRITTHSLLGLTGKEVK